MIKKLHHRGVQGYRTHRYIERFEVKEGCTGKGRNEGGGVPGGLRKRETGPTGGR